MSFYTNKYPIKDTKMDLGVKIPTHEPVKELTVSDMLELFSTEEAMRIAYIPIILTEVAFKYVNTVNDICRTKRLGFKKQTREMRTLISEYNRDISSGIHDSSMQHLYKQVEQFFEAVSWDVTTLYYAINSELKKCYPEREDYELPTFLYMAISILSYLRKFEVSVDRIIQQRTHNNISSITNPLVTRISHLCMEMALTDRIENTDTINLAIRIIGKKIDQIAFVFKDEDYNESE